MCCVVFKYSSVVYDATIETLSTVAWQFKSRVGMQYIDCFDSERHDDTHYCKCFTNVSVSATQSAGCRKAGGWESGRKRTLTETVGLSPVSRTENDTSQMFMLSKSQAQGRYIDTPDTTSYLFPARPESSTGQPRLDD